MKTKNLLYILPLAALVACEPEIDEIEFNGGSADFSRTVAVGNSLTAGYQSGALDLNGQLNSLPKMVADQLQRVGGGEFKQPLLTGEKATKGVGIDRELLALGQVQPRFVLAPTTDCLGATSLGPVRAGAPYSAIPFLTGMESVAAQGPYNNYAVPGAKLVDLKVPFANPFYARLATSQTSTLLSLAASVQASFFMLWIGNNDVLNFATEGGDESPTGATITPDGAFDTDYKAAVDALIASGADQGVVANIPDITTIPYFTTVPIGTNTITVEQATQLNGPMAYGKYNAGLDQAAADTSNPITKGFTQAMADARKIRFTAGQINTFVVMDQSLTDLTPVNPGLTSMRQARPGELMTLTLSGDSIRCGPMWGTANPIPGRFHLTLDEISRINTAVTSYNQTIKSVATSKNLAFVDANARLKELATIGITESGINFSSTLVTGGAFSLDGVHPSTRGYAIIANDFIKAINSKYGSNVPKVDVASFSTIEVGK